MASFCRNLHFEIPMFAITDRRDNRSFDLRNKLDRRRSPLHRYSPGRDARGWHGHQSKHVISLLIHISMWGVLTFVHIDFSLHVSPLLFLFF